MLLGNGIYYSPRVGLFSASGPGGGVPAMRPNLSPVSWRRLFNNDYVSFPVGYHQSARILPMKYGGCACFITSVPTLIASVAATANLQASMAGSSTLEASGFRGFNSSVNIYGACSLSAGIKATANLQCTVTIGAQPSAFDIAQAIWNATATQYNTPGTMGSKLNGAGSAGDPWGTALPGSYPPGTAGNLVGNQTSSSGLTLAQFLALK